MKRRSYQVYFSYLGRHLLGSFHTPQSCDKLKDCLRKRLGLVRTNGRSYNRNALSPCDELRPKKKEGLLVQTNYRL